MVALPITGRNCQRRTLARPVFLLGSVTQFRPARCSPPMRFALSNCSISTFLCWEAAVAFRTKTSEIAA